MKQLTVAQQIKIAKKAAEYGKSLLNSGYELDKVYMAVWNKYGYPMNKINGKVMIYVNHQPVAEF